MIVYLLKSTGCLALLLFFYHFILEKEKMHNFNRFYLLGSVLFSFLVPLTTITVPSSTVMLEAVQDYSLPVLDDNISPIVIQESFDYTLLLTGVYLLISALFLIRFGMNLFKIIQKTRINDKINHKNATLVLVDDEILPHTFWKTIFINKTAYKKGEIEEELFTHELTHVTQKHTLDVLLIEVLQIVFWINPLFIFLKKAIQLNHEFLADSTVINQHKNTFQYQHLLLNKAAWKNEYYLASNLNYSLTKKRLLMMTKQSSHTKILLKKLAVIPLLAGFVFLFAERVEAKNKEDKNSFKTSTQTTTKNNLKLNDNKKVFKNLIENIDQKYNLDTYKKLNKTYESKRNAKPHFIKSSEKRQKELTDLYSKLGGLFFKLSKADKKKVKRPVHPHDPYVRLMKNNKVFYKLRTELSREDKLLIPPPPPPPNASEEVILKAKMEYKAWKKRTGNTISVPPPPKNKKRKIKFKPTKEVKKSKAYINKNVKRELISKSELDVLDPKEIASVNIVKGKKGIDSIKIDLKEKHKKLNTKFLYTTKNSQNKSTLENSNNVEYYLDGKEISKKEMKEISPDKIKSVNVKKNKDGSGAIYITTKKL
ncbi:M56 family metallopeptidase [uncultured Polaribacter sp.]|uniref:M56 family metallopeptidase n=1 Tax=uncultured Polaribacter sp. TaxID=174711 RepID=UPI00262A2B95|nr:M56 family metallopeptidase [uncultured Polaribacter sp.]